MKNIREVDIHEYMPVLIELINEGKDVPLLVSGNSMAPFLRDKRDTIIISKPNRTFKKGDMVFYTRPTGQYVMHRIQKIDKDGNLYIVGDNQAATEGPLSPSCVFGIIHRIIRNGKVIDKTHFWWFFFEKVWINIIPFRKYIGKLVAIIKMFF